MTAREKKDACRAYFMELVQKLKDTHVLVPSCNRDKSLYLVPIGTEDQITYLSKPLDSYRYSDHWSWYSTLEKCPVDWYVQCFNYDLPKPKRREAYGKASKPIYAIQVAYYDGDRKYHHVFGEKFIRNENRWVFE